MSDKYDPMQDVELREEERLIEAGAEARHQRRLGGAKRLPQCVCVKHGPTTFLHYDQELDDFCLLPVNDPPQPETKR